MREIPKKNYLITLLIIVSIVIITIFLADIYNRKFKTTSIMYNYLSEIKMKDIDTYIIENPNIILYISDKYDTSNNTIEKKLKNDIIKYNAKDYFVYLNINDSNIDYLDKINKKYRGNIEKQLPLLVFIEDGIISKIYYQLDNINLKEIKGDIK